MNYTAKLNGKEIKLYESTILQPPYNHPDKMPFAVIVMDEPSDLVLHSDIPIENVTIRPLRLQMDYRFDEHHIYIHLDKPLKFSVEINGTYRDNIAIFASSPREENLPVDTEKIIRFAAGETAQHIRITEDDTLLVLEKGASVQGKLEIRDCSGVTVFLEEDAILHGKLLAENCTNLKICGFGAVCSERYDRNNSDFTICMDIRSTKGLEIHDICILDSCSWSCRLMGCEDVHIDNINIIGWRGNSDGVDICGSRNVLVERCFIRNWDDGFVAKAFDTGNLENVICRDSVLWNDFARPIEVGVEVRAEYARNLVFHNIDVIHTLTGYPVMGIHHGDRAKIRNVEFSDIRIEDAPGAQLFDIRITNSVWNKDETMGDIDGLLIRDIYLNGEQSILPARSRLQGYSSENSIRNVTLENLCFHGKYATTLEECHMNVMDFVENVQVKFPAGAEKMNMVSTSVQVVKPFVLDEDRMYTGTVEITLENRNPETVTGNAFLQVSPIHMADIADKDLPFCLQENEKVSRQYTLKLQAGKYVFCVQSDDPAVEASWAYEELPLILPASLEDAPAYRIMNYYGDILDGIHLAAKDNALLIRSEALRNHTFTIYSAAPVEAQPGEVKFTVEETDFGEAMAIMDGRHGLEAAPQLRCPAEITYVFKNEPKVKEIVKNTVGGEGSDTVEIPFSALGIADGSTELWFDVVANLPEVQKYRYAFAMFHSVWPHSIAHMYARAVLQGEMDLSCRNIVDK